MLRDKWVFVNQKDHGWPHATETILNVSMNVEKFLKHKKREHSQTASMTDEIDKENTNQIKLS